MPKTESLSNHNASPNNINEEESNRTDEAAGVPMEGDPPHFHRGESESGELSPLAGTHADAQEQTFTPIQLDVPALIKSPPLLPFESDEINSPREEAAQIGLGFRSSMEFLVHTCARVHMLIALYMSAPAALYQFIFELGQQGVLTANDVRAGLESSKLSKLLMIGAHKDVLLLLNLELSAGYSVAYTAVVLFKLFPGDPEDKARALLTLQQAGGGVLTRAAMEKEIRTLKNPNSRRKEKIKIGKHLDGGFGRKPTIEVPRTDLVLITPSDQRSKVVAHFNDNTTARLNLAPLTEEAIVVLVTSFYDFTKYWSKLFRGLGLIETEPFLMTKMPANADITHDEIVIFATNSFFAQMRIELDRDNWLEDVQGGDLRTLVDRTIPGAARKQHLFAPDKAEGWDCVIGEDNWEN